MENVMKLVNSRVYITDDVITKGACMLCNSKLTFHLGASAPDVFAECCGFDYNLFKTENFQESKVTVTPRIGEKQDAS